MNPNHITYLHSTEIFKVMLWEFDTNITKLPNSEKSKIYTNFINQKLKNITDNYAIELYYDDNNKPHIIKDNTYQSISISHTKNFLAIQLHKEKIAGIDIEIPREQLLKVQHKVLNNDEVKLANNNLHTLCILWTTKEALFKIHGHADISLKQNIHIKLLNNQYIIAQILKDKQTEEYMLYSHQLISGMQITYVVKKN